LVDQISKHIAGGQSPEKFLQYLDLADYSADGLRLRRAALLLFAKDVSKWHPKCEVRIVRVFGRLDTSSSLSFFREGNKRDGSPVIVIAANSP
jgi:predicted HTH transcriptional regulator